MHSNPTNVLPWWFFLVSFLCPSCLIPQCAREPAKQHASTTSMALQHRCTPPPPRTVHRPTAQWQGSKGARVNQVIKLWSVKSMPPRAERIGRAQRKLGVEKGTNKGR